MRVLLRSPRLGTVHEKETQAQAGDLTGNRIGSRGVPDASDSVSVRHDSVRRNRKRSDQKVRFRRKKRKFEPASGDNLGSAPRDLRAFSVCGRLLLGASLESFGKSERHLDVGLSGT